MICLCAKGRPRCEVCDMRAAIAEFFRADEFVDAVIDAVDATRQTHPFDEDHDAGKGGRRALYDAIAGLSLWAYDREEAAREGLIKHRVLTPNDMKAKR